MISPVRHLDWWLLGDLAHQEVHEDVFTVGVGEYGTGETHREVLHEVLGVLPVDEGGVGQDHAVLVGQGRAVLPHLLLLVPEVISLREPNNSVRKCFPHFKGKLSFFTGQHHTLIQEQHRVSGHAGGVAEPGAGGVGVQDLQRRVLAESAQEDPVIRWRRRDLTAPEDDDLGETITDREIVEESEDRRGGGDQGAGD